MKIFGIIIAALIGLYILARILSRGSSRGRCLDLDSPIPADLKFDFETPEGALRSIEDAYRRRNISAILACRDFNLEATFIVKRMPESHPEYSKMLAANSKLCRMHFLELIREHGIPEWN